MRVSSNLASLALAASTTHAATNYLINNCDFDVYYRTVGGDQSVFESTPIKAKSTVTTAQFFRVSGTTIKITKNPDGIWKSEPTLQFSYTYQPNATIWYNLSTDYGYDFWGFKVALGGINADWAIWNGAPGTDRTLSYVGEKDLALKLCE